MNQIIIYYSHYRSMNNYLLSCQVRLLMLPITSAPSPYTLLRKRLIMPRGGATAYGSHVVCVCVRLSVCLLDFLQDGTESAAESCNISITRECLENDGLRFSM